MTARRAIEDDGWADREEKEPLGKGSGAGAQAATAACGRVAQAMTRARAMRERTTGKEMGGECVWGPQLARDFWLVETLLEDVFWLKWLKFSLESYLERLLEMLLGDQPLSKP